MEVEDSYNLTYGFSYDNAYTSYADVYFGCTSSCVSVTQSGRVTALEPGTAYVNVYSKISANTPYCKVTVKDIVHPTDVSLTEPDPIYIGQKVKLTPRLYPSNAQTTFKWKSNPSDIASVDGSGNVTGKSVGTAQITVTTANNLSASCNVEVYKPVPSRIELNKPTLRLPVGGTETLTYTVTPSYAIYEVSWGNDAPDVVSVSNGRLEAKKPGTAHVTVTTDNGKAATCEVTVPPEPTAVMVNPAEMELLMGRSKKLTCSFEPSDAATASLTWESSDTKVATVNQQGEVTVKVPGHATITATTRSGVVGRCELTVPMPLFQLFVWTKAGIKTGYLSTDEPQFSVEGDIVHFTTSRLSMDIHRDTLDKFTLEQVLPEHPKAIALPERKSIALGASELLKVELTPADAETSLTWFSDNSEVVSVTQDGLVTALQVGEANLMVQTSNGLRAGIHITVPGPCLRFYVWMRGGEVHAYDLDERPDVALG